LFEQTGSQATRSEGKLVSLFWPSTEIIRKGKASKPIEFGKMVKLQEAEDQIVTDYEVCAQRPYDSDLLIPVIDRRQMLHRGGDSSHYSGLFTSSLQSPSKADARVVQSWRKVLLQESTATGSWLHKGARSRLRQW
jgi:hypothetical protein